MIAGHPEISSLFKNKENEETSEPEDLIVPFEQFVNLGGNNDPIQGILVNEIARVRKRAEIAEGAVREKDAKILQQEEAIEISLRLLQAAKSRRQ
jgi:hypothetical protein